MQNPLYKKPKDMDLTNDSDQKSFIEETSNGQELMQRELNLNQANQVLLQKRILIMKEDLNEIPSSNPQYSIMLAQIQMDNIELDELKLREKNIVEKIEKNKQS